MRHLVFVVPLLLGSFVLFAQNPQTWTPEPLAEILPEQIYGIQQGGSIYAVRFRSDSIAPLGTPPAQPLDQSCSDAKWTKNLATGFYASDPGLRHTMVGLQCGDHLYLVRFWNRSDQAQMITIFARLNISSGSPCACATGRNEGWAPKPLSSTDNHSAISPQFDVYYPLELAGNKYVVRFTNQAEPAIQLTAQQSIFTAPTSPSSIKKVQISH
jgi:hypothetical protein